MDPMIATFAILALAVVAFLSGRVPLEVVAVGVALALWATGVLSLGEALAGFADPTVLFIACLFIVAGALDRSGITRWAGAMLVRRAGGGRVRLMLWLSGITAALTALISINGAVAALVPVVVVIGRRAGIPPSQLLIPLAYFGSAASMLTLTGTPVNPLISELARNAGGGELTFFEFALVGVPLLALSVATIVLLGPRTLPAHPEPVAPLPAEREEETASLLPVGPTGGLHVRRRGSVLRRGGRRTLVIAGAMVILLATGVVPPVVAGLLAAGALLASRVLSVAEAYRAVSWTTVVLIAGMIPLSVAFQGSGAADVVADAIVAVAGDRSPTIALLILCIAVVVLGQFISNVATVLVLAPVATALSASLQVSVMPFMVALGVAGAAAFLTPIATPANLMVREPGGYRFGDYWRLGLPLAAVFVAVAVLYVPLIWRF